MLNKSIIGSDEGLLIAPDIHVCSKFSRLIIDAVSLSESDDARDGASSFSTNVEEFLAPALVFRITLFGLLNT